MCLISSRAPATISPVATGRCSGASACTGSGTGAGSRGVWRRDDGEPERGERALADGIEPLPIVEARRAPPRHVAHANGRVRRVSRRVSHGRWKLALRRGWLPGFGSGPTGLLGMPYLHQP